MKEHQQQEQHEDFAKCATERKQQLEWIQNLFVQASSSSRTTTTTTVVPAPAYGNHPERHNSGSCHSYYYYLRPLQNCEIQVLESQCRCRSSDWSKLRLLVGLPRPPDDRDPQHHRLAAAQQQQQDQSKLLQTLVTDTCFEGTCVLILSFCHPETTTTNNNNYLPPVGIHHCSIVANSIVHVNTARVHHCTRLVDTYIGAHAVVTQCGSIRCTHPQHPTVVELAVGPEVAGGSTGQRTFRFTPESTLHDLSRQWWGDDGGVQQGVTTSSQPQPQHHRMNVIGAHCTVRDTPTLDTIYLHPTASIVGATAVHECLLHAGATIRDACTVRHCFLQWHAAIVESSRVDHAVVCERAHVGPHATISNTWLGPDTHVSNGEVHASILGPQSNAHHQSLLISVLAPLGRINVGYGANVGSNHTGRLPDQECHCGEGIFWGLSCIVKFPVNLSESPYTIVAAGTTLAPQRCRMPFSLILPQPDNSNSSCILPGWVLRHSPYTMVRSQVKYAQRRQAIRHARDTGWPILRPDTIQLCVAARNALVQITTTTTTSNSNNNNNNNMLGANALTEPGRLAGIQAYTDCIQRFALQGLYLLLQQHLAVVSDDGSQNLTALLEASFATTPTKKTTTTATAFPWDTDPSPESWWPEQRAWLELEFPRHTSINLTDWACHLLGETFLMLERDWVERVYQCKRRDDIRAHHIHANAAATHGSAADHDPIIVGVRNECRVKEETVQRILAAFQPNRMASKL